MSNLNSIASNDGIEERLFKNIQSAAGKGQLVAAKEDIQRVLRLNPRHPGATFYAGLYSYETGNFENAEKFLSRLLSNETYGSKASQILADIRMNRYRGKFKETLEVYLTGESFEQALQLCKEALQAMPENSEILFKATYIACMLGQQEMALKYLDSYSSLRGKSADAAELQTFVSAWFAESYDAEQSLDRLLTITSRDLLSRPVRKRIKELIIATHAIEKYEIFINREKKLPGVDTSSLERELIGFLIEQGQYEKALQLVNMRPVDSIDDNLLYIKILGLTGEEKKAMSNARHLITAAPQDLRTYHAWIDAWLIYVEKYQEPPDGADAGGKNFVEMADEILERLKPGKLVTINPELLLNLLRTAVIIDNNEQVKLLQPEALRIPYNDELARLLIKTCNELLIFNRPSIAVDLLESARNQLPDNHNLHIKLAEIFLSSDPAAGAKVLEGVLLEKPDLLRAFLLWADCMNLAGKASEAEVEILKRLADPLASELAKRQLNAKLEVLRMQNYVSQKDQPSADEDVVEAADDDTVADPTVPQRDLSPVELTEEEMNQLDSED
ncbi:MAG: hypothetical protein PHD82_02835 [Candidatus Riflebacteria bacterium]|nr:hypothetical protein [Candidatus Riflebacteria bacterium]